MKQQVLRTVGAFTALLSFLVLLRPENLPVVALLVPFVLLYLALYSLWNLLGRVRVRYFGQEGLPKPRRGLSRVLCMGAVLLLVLQSLGQLTLRDIVTVVAIISLGYLYLTRSKFTVAK